MLMDSPGFKLNAHLPVEHQGKLLPGVADVVVELGQLPGKDAQYIGVMHYVYRF